jgi:Sigma-70, region 4
VDEHSWSDASIANSHAGAERDQTAAEATDDPVDAYPPTSTWLATAWTTLPRRQREVLIRRAAGDTLDEIGIDHSISRERVRQLQKHSEKALVEAAAQHDPSLLARVAIAIGDRPAVAREEVASELPPADPGAHTAMLRVLKIANPRTWDGDLTAWWTRKPDELDRRLRRIVELVPLSHDDMAAALDQVGLTMTSPVTELLASAESKLVQHDLGWCRPARSGRDLAFLWLQQQGAPRRAADVAAIAGTSEHAIRETMRRDDAFAQVRPEGTWALSDWHVPGADSRYSTAEETVIEVLRDLGPLDLTDLRAESQRRYPVSSWRITQCLSSAMIGRLEDGRYDLAERGAKPVEDREPKRPDNIQARGHTVGLRMEVTHDVMRGSGIPVNRWLTWYLGLRVVPSVRRFVLVEPSGELTVKRASSNAQISSLRTAVQALDLVEGCEIALVLNTETDTARLRHICASEHCPAT